MLRLKVNWRFTYEQRIQGFVSYFFLLIHCISFGGLGLLSIDEASSYPVIERISAKTLYPRDDRIYTLFAIHGYHGFFVIHILFSLLLKVIN